MIESSDSYNISVVGFSGPVELENKKDATDSIIDGIGKSSFCARFTQPHQDEYKAVDKRSIISPIDFGSKVNLFQILNVKKGPTFGVQKM